MSATTPVGTSNSTIPTVKNAFAAKASPMLRPASSRNSVLMPQIIDEALVDTAVSVTYVRNSPCAVGNIEFLFRRTRRFRALNCYIGTTEEFSTFPLAQAGR